MEAYPREYVDHNLPLVILSGLGEQPNDGIPQSPLPRQESGSKINTSSPECSGERVQLLLKYFLELDGTNRPWNAASLPGPGGSMRFKMKRIGRSYTLPPRKAAPPPQSPSTEGPPGQPMRVELHSPLSPLSPGSPVFPDGLFTPLWMSKHQSHVPALLLAFFHISSTDSNATDEKLKVDINAIRTALTRSGYRTRFAAILISDKSILHAPELEERLSSIRRLTSLDSKTGLFFMPPMNSPAEIATFVHSTMITMLQPLVVEFYRDLTKHARRKKAKGGPPPQSVASPAALAGSATLSTVGWNTRYEIKQGVFAEFRQEMDVAERHYATALDELFSSEGVFETTASWSPRWDEARLLADCLALRQLRCYFWSERSTAGTQCWLNYRSRMQNMIDRRGKGSGTYGWAAWESRWAEIAGELVKRSGLLPSPEPKGGSATDEEEKQPMQVFADPEKQATTTTDKLPPWNNLHHPGYWFALAAQGAMKRRQRALEIPEEDRLSMSTENKNSSYDKYLVLTPEKEYEHQNMLIKTEMSPLVEKAAAEFDARRQTRKSELIRLEYARQLVEAGVYQDAIDILTPLWLKSTWRREDWHELFTDLLMLLRRSAVGTKDEARADLFLATTYELISMRSSTGDDLDLMRCLVRLAPHREVIQLAFHGKDYLCPVGVSVAFESKRTHVGEPIGCQLVLDSHLSENAEPIVLSTVSLDVGNSRTLQITHASEGADTHDDFTEMPSISESAGGILSTQADLTIRPGQRRILNFSLTFREADSCSIQSGSLSIKTDKFEINHSLQDEDILQSGAIFVKKDGIIERRQLPHGETTTVKVLPKPPKIRILVHGLRKQYYTNELVRLAVEIVNGESEVVKGEVNAKADELSFGWVPEHVEGPKEEDLAAASAEQLFESIEPANAQRAVLLFRAPQDPGRTTLGIETNYRLSSDEDTPLRKTMTLDLSFTNPFDVKFSFGPLLYKDRWPSYFDPDFGSTPEKPGGIPQVWRLSAQVRSLATENVILRDIVPVVNNIIGDSVARILDQEAADREPFEPGDIERTSFELLTQKFSLDDRRPTTVESTLEISWARDEKSSPFITRFAVPRLTLPVSEPRVLCTLADTAASKTDDEEGLWDATLLYHIENPSTHFLTFALTMEATEEFAFSGPKYRTLSLAPLSRHKVEYRIILQDHVEDDGRTGRVSNADVEEHGPGRWIFPSLQVIDSYYQKTLRVHPGGTGVKFDEKQNIAVFIADK